MSRTPQEQLVHFLSDMYSVELQALTQMAAAPNIAGEEGLAADFSQHHTETERQAEQVEARLHAHGGSPSAVKDAIMKLGGKGFLLFARAQPETPGRLVAHAYAYEAMEWAGYAMLIRMAEAANDAETASVARAIQAEERTMMDRLERKFEVAASVSHGATPAEEMPQELCKHLAEAHALERQSVQLLQKSEDIGGADSLRDCYRQQLEQSENHARRIERQLAERGDTTSTTKDSALALGGINWGLFFQAQSDTTAKLAAFVYAFQHLKIGGYELLRIAAEMAGDRATAGAAAEMLAEERSMAQALSERFDDAVHSTLASLAP